MKQARLSVKHLSPYDIDRLKTILEGFGYSTCQDGTFKDNPGPHIIVWLKSERNQGE